jgi:hypothetical protein
MGINEDRQRGNTVTINGHTSVNKGAYGPATQSQPEPGIFLTADNVADTFEEMTLTSLASLTPAVDDAGAIALAARHVEATIATKVVGILNRRGWAAQASGNLSESTTNWSAMALLAQEFGVDLPGAPA